MSRVNEKYSIDFGVTDKNDLERVENEYKRFLHMILIYGTKNILISKELDNYWHTHILDTQKYSIDTKEIFGRFIHHDPFYNPFINSDGKQKFKNTILSYQSLFNEPHKMFGFTSLIQDYEVSDKDMVVLARCVAV